MESDQRLHLHKNNYGFTPIKGRFLVPFFRFNPVQAVEKQLNLPRFLINRHEAKTNFFLRCTFVLYNIKQAKYNSMPKKEGNPVQTLLIVIVVLIVAMIALTLFWPQKTNGEKVGYFLKDNDPAPTPTAITTVPGASTTSPTTNA